MAFGADRFFALFVGMKALAACLLLMGGMALAGAGLRLLLVLATEYLAPVNLSLAVPGLQPQQLAARAPAMARELLAQLPASFDDGQVTADYARHAGAALLARQLESLHV